MEESSNMRDKESMEEGLPLAKEGEEREKIDVILMARRFGVYVQEVKLLAYLAGPMVVVNLSQYFLQVISVMMVGHLGKLYLSSTAIAISFGAVSGFSLLFGMASALETFSGQAYGGKQYQKLGIQSNTAIFSLILVCLPMSLLWIYMGEILIFMGQDPLISRATGNSCCGSSQHSSLMRLFNHSFGIFNHKA
ncbi:Multi antimicrobial extrusion protein [Parasponia andersonii]|uniref:Multi antimicrobial extrusion protein n=1 Tax=Parasponia andersonii TaxID=3476 RepID=A0A2P5DK90_PARAD|nr:Multi antimicrobial extrusion protein [Parasponia andersonii]